MATLTLEKVEYRSAAEILALVREFEARTLPRARWTHAAHLTVALWYVLTLEWHEAVRRVRRGIQLYNEANGVRQTPEGGYHETLTVFWLRYVRSFLEEELNEGRSLVALANDLAARADSRLPLRHYTRERLFSPEARAGWVEPDLRPL